MQDKLNNSVIEKSVEEALKPENDLIPKI